MSLSQALYHPYEPSEFPDWERLEKMGWVRIGEKDGEDVYRKNNWPRGTLVMTEEDAVKWEESQ